MQIDQLKYFVEVVQKGSINLACEGLHISQQALSQSMRNIEKEMGFTLLLRSHKGIVPTEKGQIFFDAAMDIIDRWEKVMSKLNEDALSGTLRIAIAPYIEEYYYTALLRFIERCHLPIQLEVVTLTSNEAAMFLEKDEIDLAAVSLLQSVMDDFLLQHKELAFIPKKQIKMNILVSRYSSLAKEAIMDFASIKNQRIIIDRTEEDTDYFQKLLETNPTLEYIPVNSFYAKQSMVANNLGIALNIEGGLILSNYQHDLVEVSLQGYDELTSGILLCQKSTGDKLIEEILKAW